jgi:hypothetical protein
VSLSEDKIVNLRRLVSDPHLSYMKLLTRKQKTSPKAGASAERIRLPGARQQQSRNQAKYRKQPQIQLQFQFQLQFQLQFRQ